MNRIRTLFWLAGRDYFREWQMSGFTVLALAAVLGPMLILFGLKNGIVGSMLDQLVNNPRNLEVRSLAAQRYSASWLDGLKKREDVRFLAPEFRGIASSIQLKGEKAGRILKAELKPTGENDPLLDGRPAPEGVQILLSGKLAKLLQAGEGDVLEGRISRFFNGRNENRSLKLVVRGVLDTINGVHALAPLDLVEAIADFRDGRAVSAMNWPGYEPANNEERHYPGFRLYARSIYDVDVIRHDLELQGVQTQSQSRDIDIVKSVDRNLTAIYWLVAIIGLLGYSLSLSANLWANVDRKRRDLAVLRVVGFRTVDIVWVPMIQAFYTAILGWGLAAAIYFGVSRSINHVLAGQLQPGQTVCKLEPWHFVAALILTLVAALLSALLAGYRASRIEPSDGLREL